MSRFIAFPALGLLAACAMPPEGTSAADVARFDAAVASIGCDLVSESDYLPVELQTGLTREQVTGIAEYKLEIDEALRIQGGGVRLISGACAPDESDAAEA